jgi:hypothetical protein
VDDLVAELAEHGYFHVPNFMSDDNAMAKAMRNDAVRLRALPDKFVPSQSVGETGEAYVGYTPATLSHSPPFLEG